MFCKVMIVDDEYIMRQGIRHMIEWEKRQTGKKGWR